MFWRYIGIGLRVWGSSLGFRVLVATAILKLKGCLCNHHLILHSGSDFWSPWTKSCSIQGSVLGPLLLPTPKFYNMYFDPMQAAPSAAEMPALSGALSDMPAGSFWMQPGAQFAGC